jgi:hypothetical protein
MAKVEKNIEIPAKTSTYTTHLVCDLCGAKSHDDRNWTSEMYEFDQVVIEAKKGERYPDNGNHATTTVDLCPTCFRDKLLPWLASQGAKPRTEEVDW